MSDASWHHTPDLVERLVETIPILVKSKQQTLDFFRSAGIPEAMLRDMQSTVDSDPQAISKYYIARTVVRQLNEGGDRFLAQRREVVRRVTQWEDFSLSWPNEQDKARGLVAAVRQMVDVRDAFTRMQRERDRERQARIRQQETKLEEQRLRRNARSNLRTRIVDLQRSANAQLRGSQVEKLLADLCQIEGIQVREPFEVRNAGTPEEQIDGVVSCDGHIYLVEVKWWSAPIDIAPMSSHLFRLFRRPDARGLFISNSGYTEAAIRACRDVLSQKMMVLAELNELIFLLEGDRSVEDWIREKSSIVLAEREPFRLILGN
ncbi:restriction endonuclease [Dactylosporangium darangshiense]|uniref:Restriction endonuclease n=1 Tax=Dactylosporangium darangshiense TaxID=579108 RepID=A0ABP8DAI3_9ACTN